MLAQLKNRRFYLMALIEVPIFAMAYIGAYLLRFEFTLTSRAFGQIMLVLPWLIPLKLTVFFAFGLYKGMWRYSSLHDFWRLAQGCALSTLLVVEIVLFVYGFTGFSRAVFLLDGLLTFVMTGGVRMAMRTYHAFQSTSKLDRLWPFSRYKPEPGGRKRILIIGAGDQARKSCARFSITLISIMKSLAFSMTIRLRQAVPFMGCLFSGQWIFSRKF